MNMFERVFYTRMDDISKNLNNLSLCLKYKNSHKNSSDS